MSTTNKFLDLLGLSSGRDPSESEDVLEEDYEEEEEQKPGPVREFLQNTVTGAGIGAALGGGAGYLYGPYARDRAHFSSFPGTLVPGVARDLVLAPEPYQFDNSLKGVQIGALLGALGGATLPYIFRKTGSTSMNKYTQTYFNGVANSLEMNKQALSIDDVKNFAGKAVDKVKEVGGKAVDKAKEVGSKAVDKAKEVGGKAKEVGGKVVDKAKEQGAAARKAVGDYPIDSIRALITKGIPVGAGVGALAGGAVGGAAGLAKDPGEDEYGNKKSRIKQSLKYMLAGGAIGGVGGALVPTAAYGGAVVNNILKNKSEREAAAKVVSQTQEPGIIESLVNGIRPGTIAPTPAFPEEMQKSFLSSVEGKINRRAQDFGRGNALTVRDLVYGTAGAVGDRAQKEKENLLSDLQNLYRGPNILAR